ncbi:MAG: hypothetical protein HFJ28_06885 [Clostridia bacterium]|nr:hypothetical protein [Clostridia bacterium]
MNKFEQYRKTYPEFHFHSYSIFEDANAIYLQYEFEIPNLTKFSPQLKILKKDFSFKSIQSSYASNMAFHIGLIELISYWKCTCSPKIIIHCGTLNEDQITWWKKLYFYGLGELFFTNGITTSFEDFVTINCLPGSPTFDYTPIEDASCGYIIPIGGGKDSTVTLELLNLNKKTDYCLIINPKPVTLNCAQIAGFNNSNIIEVYRSIDKNLLLLNEKGFINGHTPFSAMLAFVSYFIAYLLSKKYIALSNENSANEANVIGQKVNHQYSKSFEFECDFKEYTNKYLKAPVTYFSFLRPLNELQIAKLFAKLEQYHNTFKSCNVGSKGDYWKWCCNCAKCLFAYIILSPYLYKEKLVSIFGTDMFENTNLLKIFLQLTGNAETKPFDCVGTFEEVNFAISKTIENIQKVNKPLPYLLDYYKKHYPLVDTSIDITMQYNEENGLNEEQNAILRKEVFSSDSSIDTIF